VDALHAEFCVAHAFGAYARLLNDVAIRQNDANALSIQHAGEEHAEDAKRRRA
jgi:hypothetical protein